LEKILRIDPIFEKKKDFNVVILALVFRLLKVKEPLFLKEPTLIINKTCSTLEKDIAW